MGVISRDESVVFRTRKLIELMSQKARNGSVRLMLESLGKLSPGEAADAIGCVLVSTYKDKEALLNALDINHRVHFVLNHIDKTIQFVKSAISVQQENIQSTSAPGDEIEALKIKIEKKSPPKEVLEVVHREVKKLQKMNEMHPSYSMTRAYLETLSNVPFNQFTPDAQEDIHHASIALDSGHFGLANAKRRILQYVAVQKLKKCSIRGPILCFVGPPGVGKTSLAKGMAGALQRKYVRVSLGGVRDEAEIRGHRRTYIGSMPGRIITGLCQIGVCDCVMLLDELDKMGHDFRGNPAAALLEVLDPEQNHSFVDTYLGVPVDLSHVIFLATANSLSSLPAALLDRLEVIKLTGYTLHEKLEIAQKHLMPKVLEENGLLEMFQAGKIEISKETIRFIVQTYTMEVGVRSLERCLSSICRHCATVLVQKLERSSASLNQATIRTSSNPSNENPRTNASNVQLSTPGISVSSSSLPMINSLLPGASIASSPDPGRQLGETSRSQVVSWCSMEKIVIDEELVKAVLGPPKHQVQSPEDHLCGSGVAAGLVWTPLGGSVQYIECCITNWRPLSEQGSLKLTGQLGEVLEESAEIALSWIKANSTRLDFPSSTKNPELDFHHCDVHVHLPSGGIQKDGPSAGITLAVALISLFAGKEVRSDTAMTGELSLRGVVLPVGGLKEKLMAAYQTGLKRVIIPLANKAEIQHEVSKEVRNALEIYPVKTLEDVLLLAFDPPYSLKLQSKM
eukprot:g5411.t1